MSGGGLALGNPLGLDRDAVFLERLSSEGLAIWLKTGTPHPTVPPASFSF